MKMIIGADLVPTKSNQELFIAGDAEALIGTDLKQILDRADYRIFNLEVPLTDIEKPIEKCGPNLIAPTETIKGYMAMGVNVLTLANNHILDQGEQGLQSTCEVLQQHGITYIGVGQTLQEVAKPHIVDFADKKVGIYACAEHEFSIVTEHTAGANPFDPLESPDHVAALKSQCDFVIVLYHGGKEHYRYPSPNLQKNCRKLVDKGADLVICQHSHCIGCAEKYNNGTIVYGQGNFLFDHSNSEYWKTSLLIQINEKFEISYLPLVKKENTVRLSDDEQILRDFEKRSEEIRKDGFIEEKYAEFAKSMLEQYLWSFSGMRRGFLHRAINKASGYRFSAWVLRRKYSKSEHLAMQNFIECEAHRELLLKGLSKS